MRSARQGLPVRRSRTWRLRELEKVSQGQRARKLQGDAPHRLQERRESTRSLALSRKHNGDVEPGVADGNSHDASRLKGASSYRSLSDRDADCVYHPTP